MLDLCFTAPVIALPHEDRQTALGDVWAGDERLEIRARLRRQEPDTRLVVKADLPRNDVANRHQIGDEFVVLPYLAREEPRRYAVACPCGVVAHKQVVLVPALPRDGRRRRD